jgi:hypothetical protein
MEKFLFVLLFKQQFGKFLLFIAAAVVHRVINNEFICFLFCCVLDFWGEEVLE